MFDIGFGELVVIAIVAVVVFGPDRLPEFARQAGRFIRQLRRFTQQARDDLRAELGPEFADLELTDLDPRRAIRKHLLDAWDDEPERPSNGRKPGLYRLADGDLPPYDVEAT